MRVEKDGFTRINAVVLVNLRGVWEWQVGGCNDWYVRVLIRGYDMQCDRGLYLMSYG